MLKGKTIVVGVSGGIAAYKTVDMVSRLKKLNADVHVVMTKNASEFITPLTFQSISHNPVVTDMFSEPIMWDIQHISLAQKADMIVIAPATANIIGKIANGIADDMLTTTVMATKAPVIFVPAMNNNMYENPIVWGNILKLENIGYKFIEPDTGFMACGSIGKGRFPETDVIIDEITGALLYKKDMAGINILITAGPTREAIDPVRYISNHSSGKMGYAYAAVAEKRGAKVRLISGPVNLKKPRNIEVIDVTTAEDMYREVMNCYSGYDIILFVAAVADYKCAKASDRKIKKTDEEMIIELARNPDIAKEFSKVKGDRIVVGTCAETNDLIRNAKEKLQSKKFDIIVANDVTQEGAGFGVDTNIVKVIKRDESIRELPIMSKIDVANEVLNEVMSIYSK